VPLPASARPYRDDVNAPTTRYALSGEAYIAYQVVGDGPVTGIAVAVGARVAASAEPGVILVSSTVKDLVAGSGLRFADRGEFALKGIPDPWRLFAVETDSAPADGPPARA
jgi:class 3 adenylate cyclase